MLEGEELVESCTSLRNANIMLAVLLLRCMQKRRSLRREVERSRDTFECCRMCLGRDALHPIFPDEEPPEKMTEQLLQTTGVQVTKDDGLPQQICTDCVSLMNEAIRFRNVSKKTERSLLSLGFAKSSTDRAEEIRQDEKRLKRNLESSAKKISKHKSRSKLLRRAERRKRKLRRTERSNEAHSNEPHSNDESGPVEFDCEDDAPFEEENRMDTTELVELYNQDPDGEMSAARHQSKAAVVVPVTLKCTLCEKVLKNKHTYVRHMVVHTGEYPYMCEQCGKGLMAYTHLVTHMKAKHGWERTDKCSYCGYLALNKSILQIHERRHTGEKPFVCDHCGMGFHRRANLLQHLPVHLPDKTVQCSLCPSAFKSIRFLRTHYNKKHKQKKYTYVCHICKNYFKTTGNVRMHLFRIHGVPKGEQGPVQRVAIADTYIAVM